MLSDIRVIMLDWGGTLVHVARQEETIRPCVQAGVAFLRREGVEPSESAVTDLLERFSPAMSERRLDHDLREFDTGGFLAAWAREHRLVLPAGLPDRRLVEAFWQPWIGCLDLFPESSRALAKLTAAGYILGLVSNCAVPESICLVELKRLGLAGQLKFIVFSSTVGMRKPHKLIYERAMTEAAALAPGLSIDEVLFVGDTPVADVDGPAAAGMRTALVRSGRWDGNATNLAHEPDLILNGIGDLPREVPSIRRPESSDRVR